MSRLSIEERDGERNRSTAPSRIRVRLRATTAHRILADRRMLVLDVAVVKTKQVVHAPVTVGGASRKSLDSQPLSQSELRIAQRGEVLSHRPIDALAWSGFSDSHRSLRKGRRMLQTESSPPRPTLIRRAHQLDFDRGVTEMPHLWVPVVGDEDPDLSSADRVHVDDAGVERSAGALDGGTWSSTTRGSFLHRSPLARASS